MIIQLSAIQENPGKAAYAEHGQIVLILAVNLRRWVAANETSFKSPGSIKSGLEALAIPYGYALPWVEVAIGLLLIMGLGLRFVAPVAILVIASLIGGTAGTLYIFGTRGPCGCLPGFDWDLGIGHITAQIVMLIMATQTWVHKGEFWSLDKRLFGRDRDLSTT